MEIYEDTYSRIIEPIYGEKRNYENDNKMIDDIRTHELSVLSRVNMTQYETYSIDPPGCTDADDAFSIFIQENKMYLAIHIADPTEYIPLHSNVWNDIYSRVTTKYPSNRVPIHMMHNKLLSLSSLQGDEMGQIKKAITVVTEIDINTYEAIHEIKLFFSEVYVKKGNAYTYEQASEEINNNEVFSRGVEISKSLKRKRISNTKGVKLSEVNTSYVIYENDSVYLTTDNEKKKQMKEMIGEFAIFANAFIGEYLKIHLHMGIFRCCDASKWLNDIDDDISGEELLQKVVLNGIKAEYLSNIASHDLVGMPEYCHFTSPIRRLSDCVCHYLLKYIYHKNKRFIDPPFSEKELEHLANLCLIVTKKDKKHQYLDTKFRLLQVMYNLLLYKEHITLAYYITGYSGVFLNLIITKIDDYNVYMSYTLRVHYNKVIEPKNIKYVRITQVNCFTKYDENTLPELDKQILCE